MKPETLAWVEKAEADVQAAIALNRRRVRPLPDHVGFLSQQAAEKYLKGFLHEHGVAFAKIHDLAALLTQAIALDDTLVRLLPEAKLLTEFAVDFRYPGMQADLSEARSAMKAMRSFRAAFRKQLTPIASRRKNKN